MSSDVIAPEVLKRSLAEDSAGACVCFEGWVRDHNEGEAVIALEYEAHQSIAEQEGQKILLEARQRFALVDARCEHRVGKLAIGDCAVWVGVSAAHRGAAFDACRYIIDETKQRVPIWKKEHYRDGHSGWVNCATNVAGEENRGEENREE
ncbi:MAG TPA: molybdenum cofactor biosynthesis protein MoaE, partial [Gammaproteobacteria bacterium]|nr:molybdenum cofactor biosynthesis protein MoaE [Gammaproteobacteria bacterium]